MDTEDFDGIMAGLGDALAYVKQTKSNPTQFACSSPIAMSARTPPNPARLLPPTHKVGSPRVIGGG